MRPVGTHSCKSSATGALSLRAAAHVSIIVLTTVYLSTATDPYQPLEAEHEVTRRCLEILAVVQERRPPQIRGSPGTREVDAVGIQVIRALTAQRLRHHRACADAEQRDCKKPETPA